MPPFDSTTTTYWTTSGSTTQSNAPRMTSDQIRRYREFLNQIQAEKVLKKKETHVNNIETRLMKKLDDKELLKLVEDILASAVHEMENDCVDDVYRLSQLKQKVSDHLSK